VPLLAILSDPRRDHAELTFGGYSTHSIHFLCSLFPTLLVDPYAKRLIDCTTERSHERSTNELRQQNDFDPQSLRGFPPIVVCDCPRCARANAGR
jgi:hypothetical protein